MAGMWLTFPRQAPYLPTITNTATASEAFTAALRAFLEGTTIVALSQGITEPKMIPPGSLLSQSIAVTSAGRGVGSTRIPVELHT